MTTPTILVAGASGTVGSTLVPALLRLDVHVRAMSRDAEYAVRGAQTVRADLRQPDTLAAALDGVDAVFVNSPSTEDAAELQMRFLDRAVSADVSRVVLLSQYGARADSPVRFLRWHAAVESHLQRLGMPYTILRPNLYLQSLLGFADTIAQGLLAAPIGGAEVSAIDTRDIAEVAAAVLASDKHDGQIYTLTGPRAVTHSEIAAALSSALDTPVAVAQLSSEQFAAALGAYLPSWQLEGLIEDYAHYNRGEAAEVTTAVADLTGRRARDVVDFARDHAGLFARS